MLGIDQLQRRSTGRRAVLDRFQLPVGRHVFCHRPLYFEEINLERYGYGCGWCLQPGASAAHFFGTVPALPYLMTVDCPHECIYTLGHYRPGSCPPWRATGRPATHWPLRPKAVC